LAVASFREVDRCQGIHIAGITIVTILAVFCTRIAPAYANKSDNTSSAIRLGPGPHLFLDDYLIAQSHGLTRRVTQPQRAAENPLIPNALPSGPPRSGCSDKEVSVVYDADANTYKMWHYVDMRHNPDVVKARRGWAFYTPVYRESKDGVHWSEPRVMTGGGGATVLLDPATSVPSERFKATDWSGRGPLGMNIFFSPDGITWRPMGGGPVLLTPSNDIWTPSYDPLLERYTVVMRPADRLRHWTDVHGQNYSAAPRETWITTSTDFKKWTKPRPLFVPDSKDEGITQWYGGTSGIRRGEHFIVFLRELRDDLKATRLPGDTTKSEPESRSGGIGYTVLMWTIDGEHWQRDRYTDKFLAPDPDPKAWDHAHAWIGAAVPVGDELWLYYGGYKYGHKYYKDRCIGKATMKRDRFVAREAAAKGSTLLTKPLILKGDKITVNACVRGTLQVRLLNAVGKPIPGFDVNDCAPIHGDSVALPLKWKKPLAAVNRQPVQIEFQMRDCQLFGFGLAE
jgi:hypothetical protein